MGPDPTAFAALLCGYCLEVQPGQQVVVRSTTLAAPLIAALQRELLEREAWPLIRAELPGADEAFWAAARDAHLDAFAPFELAEAEGTDASIGIQAPDNTRALSGVAAERMARAARVRGVRPPGAVPRPRRRARRLGGAAGVPGAVDRAPVARERAADRGRGHRPDAVGG